MGWVRIGHHLDNIYLRKREKKPKLNCLKVSNMNQGPTSIITNQAITPYYLSPPQDTITNNSR